MLGSKQRGPNVERAYYASALTCALLSVCEMRGYGDGAFLTHADSNQAFVHACNHVASTHVGVVGVIARVAVRKRIPHREETQ